MNRSEAGRLGGIALRENEKKRKELRIINYSKKPNRCKLCDSALPYKKRRQTFCSHSCAQTFNNKGKCRNPKTSIELICAFCHKQFVRRKNDKVEACSLECRSSLRIRRWLEENVNESAPSGELSGLIVFWLKAQNKCCQICGWKTIHPVTQKCPLEIDHIDGDSSNNRRSNIRVLCPNCHSLTPTFRGLNRGKSSRNRKKAFIAQRQCNRLVSD